MSSFTARLGAEHVKPTCRQVKGDLAAFYAACDKLRERYTTALKVPGSGQAVFEISLSVLGAQPEESDATP